MKQALIVIDVQESFRRRAYFREEELPAFLRNLQSLIDQARSRDIPIVQVFHRELPDDATNAFSVASGQVRAMPELSNGTSIRFRYCGWQSLRTFIG